MRRIAVVVAAALFTVPPTTAAQSAPTSRPSTQPTLVVLNKSGASVSLLDPVTGDVHDTVPVGAGPHEAATSPDGRTIVVTNYGQREPGGSLTVIDTARAGVRRTIELTREADDDQRPRRFLRPHGIAFLPDGHRVVVTTELQRRLLIVDVHEGRVLADINTGARISHMVALARDASRAYVANIGDGSVSVLDLEKHSLLTVVETGAGAEGIAVHPTRDELWVTNRAADSLSVLHTESNAVVAELACGSFPIRIAFTPDGDRALVSCARDGTVECWDVAQRKRIATIEMDAAPIEDTAANGRLFTGQFDQSPVPVGILIQPDGAFAYVANTQSDLVTVIDLAELAIARRLSAGPEPDGMTWIPAR